MTYIVLVPDNVDQKAIHLLEKEDGISVNGGRNMSREETMSQIPEADALIIRSSTQVDREMIEATTRLKVIARAGVGVDNVDLDAATERGIIVMNTPDGNTIATAEHTFGLMLALARHIPQGHASLADGRWDRKAFVGVELRGKTLGIIGYGRIGRAVAKRALAFEMHVLAYDPFVDDSSIAQSGASPVDLDELYGKSDFITLHSLINDGTREMIYAESILKMKTGVRIINAARGALINETDLANAIKHGHVAGAALDVYQEEPPTADNPLIGLENVIHTPHLAASTTDAQINVGIDAAQEIIDALKHGDYRNVVNTSVLDKVKST